VHVRIGAVLVACAATLGDRVCNRQNGLCELNPCSAGCGEGFHCEVSGAVPRCALDGEKFSVGGDP